ncbi:MAG: serine hydrolase domain-containing protein [Cyclobacteriaceae bacterium]
MKARILTTTLLTGLTLGTLLAQTFNKPKLDSLMNALAEKNKAMGSVVISKKGKVIYSRAIGQRSISGNQKLPANDLTRYRIGSITKTFTATMIFQLIEEGKLSLATTVDAYFPQLPNAGKITISNLLNHRSGLHNFTDDPTYESWMTQPKTHEEMLAQIARSPVDFQPNERFSYSNSNYVVLGYILEKITKATYQENLQRRITSKIGLANTYVGGKTDPGKNESYSYHFSTQWEQGPETDLSIPAGAGAIVSTPTDLVKFIEALFALKLISDGSLTQMKTLTDGYGMGMFPIPFYDKMAYGHNGGIDGFVSILEYFPDDSLAIAYCTNGHVYPYNNILIGVSSIYFNKPYAVPTFRTIALKSEDLDKYLGVYASTLIPLKITITKDGTTLISQATDQSAIPLEATDKHTFTFDPAGIVMEFNPDKKELTLKQGGETVVFTKEN